MLHCVKKNSLHVLILKRNKYKEERLKPVYTRKKKHINIIKRN